MEKKQTQRKRFGNVASQTSLRKQTKSRRFGNALNVSWPPKKRKRKGNAMETLRAFPKARKRNGNALKTLGAFPKSTWSCSRFLGGAVEVDSGWFNATARWVPPPPKIFYIDLGWSCSRFLVGAVKVDSGWSNATAREVPPPPNIFLRTPTKTHRKRIGNVICANFLPPDKLRKRSGRFRKTET